MLLVRDMKHTWNSHINILFSSRLRLKIQYQKLCIEKNHYLIIIFKGTYQIGYVRQSVSFKLTKIYILKTRDYVYICVYSQKIERRRLLMQTYIYRDVLEYSTIARSHRSSTKIYLIDYSLYEERNSKYFFLYKAAVLGFK